jgi:hypothetical protein
MTGEHAPLATIKCTSGEGTPNHDGAAGLGGGSCVKDRDDKEGRHVVFVDDTELTVELRWSVVNWFTTSPMSMATT